MANRIYLRVWDDQIERRDGVEWLRIGYGHVARRSNGYAERNSHVEMILAGMDGYGVICTAKERVEDEARKIISFNDRVLAKLGELMVEGDNTYAKVEAYVPVSELSRPTTSEAALAGDIRAIGRLSVDSTTKERLINARVGQGQFRADVLRLWGGCCAVTGVRTLDVIRASHIKPWRRSINEERLDANNGLPLVANLDALFDAGLISFSPDGVMLVSSLVDVLEHEVLSLIGKRLRRAPSPEVKAYLEFHRTSIFNI